MNAMTEVVTRQGSGVYAQMVGALRETLTAREIAEASGVAERQIHHWRAGETKPRGSARERLLELQYVIEGLGEIYTPEGVEVFWHGRQRELGGKRPSELAAGGNYEPIVELVGELRDSNY